MNRPTYCRRNSVTLLALGGLAMSTGALAQEPPGASRQDSTPQHEQTTPDTASERYESSTHSSTRETARTESTGQAERSRERMSEDQERTQDRQRTDSSGSESFVATELHMMDVDKDGSVSMREHETGARRMFETMDADHDGEVTSAEMQASSRSMPSARDPATASTPAKAKIAAVDRNADGKLTAEEHAEASRDMFGKLDGDRNGALSPNELQIGRDMMRTTEQPTSRH